MTLTLKPSMDSLATRVDSRPGSLYGDKTEDKLEGGKFESSKFEQLAFEPPAVNPFLVDWDGPTDPDNPR